MTLYRSTTVAGLAILALALVPAAALGFSGPWNSAGEPPPVQNAGVSVGTLTAEDGENKFQLVLSPHLWCPDGHDLVSLTVVISEPMGAAAVTGETQQRWYLSPCNSWEWANTATTSEVFLDGATGSVPEPEAIREWTNATVTANISLPFDNAPVPFLYEVVGPSGVVARGALTADKREAGTALGSNKITDISECQRKKLDVFSGPSGQLYCEETYAVGRTENTFIPGWPVASLAAEPITLRNAGEWAQVWVEVWFNYRVVHFHAAHCVRRAKERYSCVVSWRHGVYAFEGRVEVSRNHFAGRVTRINVRTHQRHLIVGSE